jgi:predicted CXXCH cytochrome family protein
MFRRMTLAALAPLMAAGMAYGAAGSVVGTAHDFSDEAWADNQICKPCHTPHHTIRPDLTTRLWNHEISTAEFTVRGDPALDAETLGTRDPRMLLCMSCHDGTVALDAYGGKIADGVAPDIGDIGDGRRLIGTNLMDDHPVGPTSRYQTTGSAATRYKSVESGSQGTFRPVGSTVRLYAHPTEAAGTYMLSCTSCHDVHNGADADGGVRLLRMSNDSSDLCLACHNK